MPQETPAEEPAAPTNRTTEDTAAPNASEHEAIEAAPISPEQQRQAQAVGRGIWLALALGAAGLMLTLLLPWAQVYYLNPLQPLQIAGDGAIRFTRDEVVHVSLQGFQMLTLPHLPLLMLFIAASLLFGAAIFWRQTRFLAKRFAVFLLCLGLLVGLGFPAKLLLLLNTNQQVDWNNSHATIEANNNVHDFSAKDGKLYLCTPAHQGDTTCDSDYSHGVILNAGIDWVEINGATGKPLIRGHAQAVRPSSTSPDVTSSGYAIGPLGFMSPGIGYWSAWLFGGWTLLWALALANRLRKTRKKPTRK